MFLELDHGSIFPWWRSLKSEIIREAMSSSRRPHRLCGVAQFFGIAPERIVERRDELWWVQEICIPDMLTGTPGHGRRSDPFYPAVLKLLRENLLHEIFGSKRSSAEEPVRLYLSHPEEEELENEAELESLLRSYGFMKTCLEEMSLREQLALSGSAECLVGLHGPGMAHALFARPGSLLIEIFPSGGVQHTNFAANALMKHRHFSVTPGGSRSGLSTPTQI